MEKRTAKLVTFGNGGDTVYVDSYTTITGYGRPENPHAAKPGVDLDIPDGTPVVDTRPAADTESGFSWFFRGPLVGIDLPEHAVEKCPTPSALMASAMVGTEYGTLLALQACHNATEPKQAGPLDKVPISVYVRGWKEHGARVGHYQNGLIVWD